MHVYFLHVPWYTFFTISLTWVWSGVTSISPAADVFNSGITDMTMRVDMNREHIGSATSHPNCWTRREEMITPTLPIVSAKMWRKTPVKRRGGRQVLTLLSANLRRFLINININYPSPTRSVCEDMVVGVCVCVCVLALNS